MLSKEVILNHYKKKEIQDEILALAEGREVTVRYLNGGFGKRPDILQYPSEILSYAKQGASSFHASEEHWHDPMNLKPGMTPKELEENRKGWDLILDIDCPSIDIAKHTAVILKQALDSYDVPFTIKFSGRSGFHFGIAFQTFPDIINKKMIKTFFPEGARVVADYLSHLIKKPLTQKLLEHYSFEDLQKITNLESEKLKEGAELNPFSIVAIDTVLISARHLFRMPYSLHEKSGLVSIPIDPDKISEFTLEQAKPENIHVHKERFLTNKNGNTHNLFIAAMDYASDKKRKEETKKQYLPVKKEYQEITESLPEILFPPCMFHLNKGIEDGKKRALFTAVNFLKSVGWGHQQIEGYLLQWNSKNPIPLRDAEIRKHIAYHIKKPKVLPPNCDNPNYYTGINICHPDELCKKIKNPVSYVRRKHFMLQKQQEEAEKLAKKEARRKAREKKQQEKVAKIKAEREKQNQDSAQQHL